MQTTGRVKIGFSLRNVPAWRHTFKMSAQRPNQTEPEPRPVSTLAGALWDEFEAIHAKPRAAATAQGPDASLHAYYDAALETPQAALCLSGGGIRSAAFSLGVLQALARSKLLTSFHYLSTVSGGGYIGGWLLALLHERGFNAAKVQCLLAADTAPPELDALRRYTDYLAPHPGLASPDTWAGIILWLRNVLVNWLIFFPALFALAMLPNLYRDILAAIGPGWSLPLLLIALAGLGIGIFNGVKHAPSHGFPEATRRGLQTGFVPWRVVVPLMLWSSLVPLVAAPWLRPVMPSGAVSGDMIPLLGFIVMELGFLLALATEGTEDRELLWHNFGWWTLASLAATVVLWVALCLGSARNVSIIAVLGPLAVTLAHLVQSLVYVALRTEAFRGDLDREWLARLSGEKVMPALLWAGFAAICLFLPAWVLDGWSTAFVPFVMSAVGLLTGPVAAYLGKIAPDVPGAGVPGSSYVPSLRVVINVIAAVFGVVLFMLLARLGTLLSDNDWGGDVLLLIVAVLLALGCGGHINVNRFSMHAVYRNRLVRAFLGSARPDRTPDGFTDIDPKDNPRMADLQPPADNDGNAFPVEHPAAKRAPRMLFPVINATLNLVATRNTAWTERKGESFTITPARCGGAYLHRREDQEAGLPVRGAYVRTEAYAGHEKETGPDDKGRGITLGTALTVSGAAVSPSMGYNSSPATAFLMTLFNVRLGAWLPNPAMASTRQLLQAKPPNALLTLARELLGLTDDLGNAVYLSDGGHFDNLGLYEMVRRRCRYIIVVDAGEDGKAWFEDLGNAIRKARIDFDVKIDFDPPVGIGSRDKPATPFRSFACATIHYPESKTTGRLIYLKPSDPPDMPMDVRSYFNAHPNFPHDSTVDQFFTESEFESYRQLGETEALKLISGDAGLEAFFAAADKWLRQSGNAKGCGEEPKTSRRGTVADPEKQQNAVNAEGNFP